MVKASYEFGGDDLSAVPASAYGLEKIQANAGLLLAGGVSLTNEAKSFALETTVGWKSESYVGSVEKYEFSRTPVDVLAFYILPPADEVPHARLRLGGGATYHISPRLRERGNIANSTTDFDNALGFVAQIDVLYTFARDRVGINFGLRYTDVNYKTSGVPTINAQGIGVFVGARFPIGL